MRAPLVAALILAGGRASRMGGGDKCLLEIDGRTILERIVEILRPQCDAIVLSANGRPERFAAYDLPVVADDVDDIGPLGGLLAGLDWIAAHRPDIDLVLSVPGDTPFLPTDLRTHLGRARKAAAAEIAIARSGGRAHPTVALWRVDLREALRDFIATTSRRSVTAFAERQVIAYADWPIGPPDPFANVNTPADLASARGTSA